MTTEHFLYIVKNQKIWKEMYMKQKAEEKREYQQKCKEYQEVMRRQRGAPIRFPKSA
jgi:hypothetical protein